MGSLCAAAAAAIQHSAPPPCTMSLHCCVYPWEVCKQPPFKLLSTPQGVATQFENPCIRAILLLGLPISQLLLLQLVLCTQDAQLARFGLWKGEFWISIWDLQSPYLYLNADGMGLGVFSEGSGAGK